MPQVRVYERTQSTAPLQGGRLTGALTERATGVDVERANQERGEAISRAGKQVQEIGTEVYARQQAEQRREAEEARQFANDMAVIEGRNKLDAWQRDAMYDPENGALAKKGKDAFGLPEQVDAEFEKAVSTIGETMTTPEQKLGWARVVQQERARTQLEVRRHVDREMQVYTAAESQARVANGIASTVRLSTTPDAQGHIDPSRGLVELNQTVADYRAVAPKMGHTPEQMDEQERDIRTRAHTSVISTLLAEQKTQAAKVYFEEVQSQIDPKAHDEITNALRTGSVRADAQKETEKILSNDKLTTLEQQRAEAKKITDPDVQDDVINRLEHEFAIKKQQEQAAREEQSVVVGNILDKSRNVTAIPPHVWNGMNMTQKTAARNYVQDLVTTGQPTTNREFQYSLFDEAQKDPKKFAERNLADITVRSKLSNADWEEVVRLQRSVREGNQKAAQEGLEGYQTSTQIVDSILTASGLDTSPKPGSKEAATVTALRTAVDQQVAAVKAAKAEKGQKISSQDVREITDMMMRKVVTEKGSGKWSDLFTFGGHYSDVEKRIGEVTIDDVPNQDRADIRDALLRAGKVPTEAEVVRVYRIKLSRDAQALDAQKAASPGAR